MNLDNSEEFKKLDPMGVEKALALFPEQIKDSLKQASGADIPEIFTKSVIVSGMGGSSKAAKIIQGVFEDDLDFPFEVRNDYGLPAWVNEDTLVIANSYSGNTEETLSAIDVASKIGSRVLGVTTGGKIGEMIKSKTIMGVIINPGDTNPTGFPKTGLGVSLGALTGALIKIGVLPIKREIASSAIDNLVKIRDSWDVKDTAKWLYGSVPVLFGGKPLVGALNAGRNAMCEISRNFSQFYDFPEVNHVLIEALQKPESVLKNKYLFFESGFNNERVRKRYEITKGILNEMGLMSRTYLLKSDSAFGQALELAHYSAWLGFYISMLDGVDPGPEPWILKLKSSLSQPVH